MGAHPYQYVVDYDEDVQAALDRLRQDVFRRRAYRGAGRGARSPDEALAQSDEAGTRSILDITHLSSRPAQCAAAPVPEEERERYFGTSLPTLAAVEESDAFWGELERGEARYLPVLDGVTKRLLFVGYSFD